MYNIKYLCAIDVKERDNIQKTMFICFQINKRDKKSKKSKQINSINNPEIAPR